VAQWVNRVRASVGSRGHAAVLHAPARVSRQVSRWGDLGSNAALIQAVKAQFDPRHTLCPGGGPGGLA
jgi:FAD/FMN-containing dehydrogenase